VTREKGDWTYGRVEVRAKLPSGRGTWPAIWMLPTEWRYGGWPHSGEIDIMEHVGFDPDIVHATVHTGAYNHAAGTQRGAQIEVPTARAAFNVYAIEWAPEEIRGYVNDTHYFTFENERLTDPSAGAPEWPFDQPFHLLLNIAVGGTWGGAQGVDPEVFPQQLVVDYVRVYRLEE
jgi:licheninase